MHLGNAPWSCAVPDLLSCPWQPACGAGTILCIPGLTHPPAQCLFSLRVGGAADLSGARRESVGSGAWAQVGSWTGWGGADLLSPLPPGGQAPPPQPGATGQHAVRAPALHIGVPQPSSWDSGSRGQGTLNPAMPSRAPSPVGRDEGGEADPTPRSQGQGSRSLLPGRTGKLGRGQDTSWGFEGCVGVC